MTSDADDALSWEGDDDRPQKSPALPQGWHAVGKGSDAVASSEASVPAADAETDGATPVGMSTVMLLLVGVFGGVYLLYTIGWIVGGLNMKPLANLIVADAMYLPWFVLAVLAPALWMLVVWLLTKGRAAWIRVALLIAGAVLLVPWPFVMLGAVGS